MKIRAWCAWRPAPGLEHRIAAPPYDVVTRDEAAAIAAGNPACFLRISRSDLEFPPSVPSTAPEVYARARENWRRAVAAGWFVQDESPALFLYRLREGDHVQTGLAALYPVADYEAGIVKRHEWTRPEPEGDRARHIATTGIQSGPVYLAFRDVAGLAEAMDEECMRQPPLYDLVAADGVRHTVWKVQNPAEWIERMAAVPCSYIADGHHRAAAAARVARDRAGGALPADSADESAWVLAVWFPSHQLRILPYNRVVRDLGGMSEEDFLNAVQRAFHVEPADTPVPSAPGDIRMGVSKGWWKLTLRGPTQLGQGSKEFDATVLQEVLLDPVLGIRDPRRDPRLSFVGGKRAVAELEELRRSGRAAAVFSLHPVTIERVMAVADAGGVMPPKSTWFEPKLRSGLLVHAIS